MKPTKFYPLPFFSMPYTKKIFVATLSIIMMLPFSDLNAAKSNAQLEKEITKLKKGMNKLNKKLKKQVGGNRKKLSRLPKISGVLQQDTDVYSGAYHSDNPDATASDTFVRRLRLGLSKKHADWSYFLLLDFSNDEDFKSEVVMARLRYSGFKTGPTIDIGKIREDISLEALTSSSHINTVSRSMLANTMSPYFNWGVSINQQFKSTGLRYALGVYKGQGFGSSGTDENDRLLPSISGRLSWAPFIDNGKILHLGIWSSHRKFGDDVNFYLRDRAEIRATDTRLVDYAAGGSAFPIDTLIQTGVEFAFAYNSFTLQSEYAIKQVEATNASNDNDYDGHYINLSYFITGEKMNYRPKSATLRPAKPNSKSGAWEIVARNSEFDASSDNQGTMVTANTIGINYYYSKNLKFMLNYIKSDVSGPARSTLVGAENQGTAYAFRMHYAF